MAKVVRLFGKADSFDIEFSRKAEKWTVDIPPDLVDGVYAVQLTAIDELGEVAYWVGELYMCNGACCIKIIRRLSKSLFSMEKYGFKTAALSKIKVNNLKKYRGVFNERLNIIFDVEEKFYNITFSAPNCVELSKNTDIGFSTKEIYLKDTEDKMLIQCGSTLSIRKECCHV